MAHVCYSLYFTDFVGEAVFNGDPKAVYGSVRYNLYEEGVRFGCFGMAMYSLSCACYSLIIEKLISRFRAKNVYVGGVSSKSLCQECVYYKNLLSQLLFYCVSMTMMALTRNKFGVIVFSWGAGKYFKAYTFLY